MRDDGPIPLSRFTAALARARGRKRLEALVEGADAPARVAALPVQDLYYLIQEVGLEEATTLVELATPEQFQGLLDLDVWDRDRLRDADVGPWLAALVDAGPEKLAEVWRELDPELTALLFKRWTRIYQLAEEEVPEGEEPPFVPTPDGFFLIKVIAEDGETIRLVEALIDRLYRADPVLARHTLRAAASEPFAELEETSQRWRAGRMAELGYADPFDALAVYQPIDLGSIKIGEGTADRPPIETRGLPLVLAEGTVRQPFLGRVLAQITEATEAERLEAALIVLINQVLSANRIEPRDVEGAALGAAEAAAVLSLGLETVAKGDVERAREALRSVALVRLFRAGHTVTLQLAQLGATLRPLSQGADNRLETVLEAVRAPRPRFPRVLDDPPGDGTRAFAQVSDVRRVTDALGLLGEQVRLVRDRLGAARDVPLAPAGRAAVARALLGATPSAAPLPLADVTHLIQAIRSGSLPEKIALGEEFPAAVLGFRADLERELGRLDPASAPEPRYLQWLRIE